LHVSELLATLEAPVYIERVALEIKQIAHARGPFARLENRSRARLLFIEILRRVNYLKMTRLKRNTGYAT